MIEMCELLLEHVADERKLAEDPVAQAAAQRWIEVIGEAASHVSEELKLAHPDVAWREIIGIRVILAHGYFHIEDDIIGSVVAGSIPNLRVQLQSILGSLSETN